MVKKSLYRLRSGAVSEWSRIRFGRNVGDKSQAGGGSTQPRRPPINAARPTSSHCVDKVSVRHRHSRLFRAHPNFGWSAAYHRRWPAAPQERTGVWSARV